MDRDISAVSADMMTPAGRLWEVDQDISAAVEVSKSGREEI